MCACNQSFFKCNPILSRRVTAGPTFGLILSIHLQRHCQAASATMQPEYTAAREKVGGRLEQRWILKEGRKKSGKGDTGGGGDRKRAE